MEWKDRKVLVTGAAGFIGSHLVEELGRLGADVTAFLRYSSRGDTGLLKFLPKDLLSWVRIIRGDLKDPDAVLKAAKDQEVIFHLAALIGIPYSYVHPLDYVQTNVVGTTHLLNACLAENIEKVIVTSTSEVYGTAKYVPIDEEHPLQGQSPYSASKIAADQIALSYYRSFGMPVTILRPFNTYGPRQSTRAVIPTIISQALKKGKVQLGSLTPTRDLTYVSDTVNGFIKIAEAPSTSGEVINIGASKTVSIGALAKLIFDLLEVKIDITEGAERIRPEKSEVGCLMANNEKAKKLMGWSPEVSLSEGLRRTIQWIKNRLSMYDIDEYHV